MEYVIIVLCVLYCTHQYLKRFEFESSIEYFILHTLANTCIAICSYNDLIQIMFVPLELNCYFNSLPSIITLCLHFYHVLFFKVQRIEYIHHVLMMSILIYPVLHQQHLCLANVILFFTSGLPGLIIYISLIMYKLNYITRSTQIQIDKKVNIYLRSPGILFCIFILYIRPYPEKLIVYLIQSILFWNAQYFTDLAANRS